MGVRCAHGFGLGRSGCGGGDGDAAQLLAAVPGGAGELGLGDAVGEVGEDGVVEVGACQVEAGFGVGANGRTARQARVCAGCGERTVATGLWACREESGLYGCAGELPTLAAAGAGQRFTVVAPRTRRAWRPSRRPVRLGLGGSPVPGASAAKCLAPWRT